MSKSGHNPHHWRSLDAAHGPTVITSGPDGALWFTEYRADRIGRITTDGVIDEFGLPTPGFGPFGIAPGTTPTAQRPAVGPPLSCRPASSDQAAQL